MIEMPAASLFGFNTTNLSVVVPLRMTLEPVINASFEDCAVMTNVDAAWSTSFTWKGIGPEKVPFASIWSGTVLIVGPSFWGVMVIETVATVDSTFPSETAKANESLPVAFVIGW